MESEGVNISKTIYDYLDRHPNESLKRVQNVHNQHNKQAVKTAYYRWRRRGQTKQASKRSDSVSKNDGTDGTSIKRSKSPTNLSKIDEDLLEAYLLNLVDFDHPDVRIAREMSSFIDRKKGFKQEETVKIEFLGVDKDEQIALAEAYRTDIEKEIP